MDLVGFTAWHQLDVIFQALVVIGVKIRMYTAATLSERKVIYHFCTSSAQVT